MHTVELESNFKLVSEYRFYILASFSKNMDPSKLPLTVMAKTAISIMITQPDVKARTAMVMAGFREQDGK
jgi:hypothetical protein